jgi:hypothetical protein
MTCAGDEYHPVVESDHASWLFPGVESDAGNSARGSRLSTLPVGMRNIAQIYGLAAVCWHQSRTAPSCSLNQADG